MSYTPSPEALPTGSRLLDEYRIERELAGDGVSTTYLARELAIDRGVLITEYLPRDWGTRRANGIVGPRSAESAEAYARGLDRFLAGARVLARVDHPQIARVHRVAKANGTAYLVTEQVRGRNLEEEIEAAGPLSEERVRRIMDGLAAGLAEVHALGMLHLDIRPRNVMLRARDDTAVLVGFALAGSQTGTTAVTPWTPPVSAYAPIEQYSPTARRGPWSDTYALAAVAYTALTGEVPTNAPERAQRDTLPDVATAAPTPVGQAVALAVGSAMRLDATERPQDLGEWSAMLSGEAMGQPEPVAARMPATPPVRVGRRRMFYAAGIAVVALGVTVLVSVSRNSALTPEQLAAATEARLELTSETIEVVEKGLAAEGHYAGEADGVLEPGARAGLRQWQASQGIEETGYLDRESLAALFAVGREAEEQAEAERLEAERQTEAQRLAEERQRAQEQQFAEARQRAERRRLEFERQLEAQRLDAERLEAERLAEEALLAEEARLAQEARLEAERQAERQAEEARLEEEARLAEEARLEAERQAEEERLAEARRRFLQAQGDSEVLLAVADDLAGPMGLLDWSRGRNWTSWTGVQLEGGAVTGIDLSGKGLSGAIPETLGFLRQMQYLNLADNQIPGGIPAELGALGELEFLYLQGNRLSGEIPAELGSLSRLEDLYLQGNPLTGSIPPELGNLGNLRRLNLSQTRVAGRIPPELGKLQRLEVLSLERNQLSGGIPPELGNLSNLRRLSLNYNRLSGCIPEALSRFEANINPQLDGVSLPRCLGQRGDGR